MHVASVSYSGANPIHMFQLLNTQRYKYSTHTDLQDRSVHL